MPPLPRELPEDKRGSHHVVSAYNLCLTLEASLQNWSNDATVVKKLIYVRILGYLLHHMPSEAGLQQLVTEIVSFRTEEAFLKLGLLYFEHAIRLFRANKDRTPFPSNHPSRPSFDTVVEMINDTLDEAPQSHAAAKKKALSRDGYRCVVTKKYDAASIDANAELGTMFDSDPSNIRVYTECAHIFAESTNADIEPGSYKRDYAATAWAVMKRFGHDALPDELNGIKVHRLENVMTMDMTVHRDFDRLSFWFDKTDEENTYKIEATNSRIANQLPKFVTFTTPNPEKLPVPSPTYLAIHAACAKVAHLSGASEYIDKFHRDLEDGTTLNADGSGADLLDHALELHVASSSITA